jgi:hypothetical protein
MKGTNSLEALGDRKTCFDFLGDRLSQVRRRRKEGLLLGSCLRKVVRKHRKHQEVMLGKNWEDWRWWR